MRLRSLPRRRRMFAALLIVLAIALPFLFYAGRPAKSSPQRYGVSFSMRQARALDLDAAAAYRAIVEELGVRRLRLAAYWDELEPTRGSFDFAELDWQLTLAAERDAAVLLAVGQKLPRWPECFVPAWVVPLSSEERRSALLAMLETVIRRYDNHPAVTGWQLENEPFVSWFGDCPSPDEKLLQDELALVRRLSAKPVLITDSGELSTWRHAARLADRFGTTLYRTTWNPYFGYGTYPLPAWSYRFKARLNGLDPAAAVIAELQAEPWPPGTPLTLTPLVEQFRSMSSERLQDQIAFAERTGFGEAYLWGVEWWYWLKETQGHPEFWEAAREIFNRRP